MSRRLLFRSCSLFLRSSLVRCSFYATSSSAAPVQQFPEPDKERVLQLADTFEASKKSTKAFVVIMDRFRKWVEENNQPAPSSIVKLLLPICLGSRNTHDIDIAVDYIKRRGWKAGEEGLMNFFIVSMVKSGQYTKALEIYQRINDSGKRLRLTGICALLEAAADEGDFPTMLTLSQELKKTKAISVKHTYMHTSSIKHVLLACKGVEDTVAMEATSELLDTLRICRLKLNQEMACVIEEWAESSKHTFLGETIVNYSGKCSGCGLTLQRGDITPNQLEVLRQQVDAIFKKVFLEQSRNIEDDRNKLNQLKEMVSTNDFGMIIDGLNVSHVGRKVPDRRLLLLMAGEAIDVTGKPVLIILRKHDAKWITTQSMVDGKTLEIFKSQGIYPFFTDDLEDNDLYFTYAALHSKPSTYLLSNDEQRSLRGSLPEDFHFILDQLLRTRRARVRKLRYKLHMQLPPVYDDTLQWSPPESGPSWENLHIPLDFRRRWLCIKRKLPNNSTGHKHHN